MMGVTIHGKVAWMVGKDCPCSFYYRGAYYVWDKDYWKAVQYYRSK